MLKLIICGCGGKMGRAVAAAAAQSGFETVAGIDSHASGNEGFAFPVYGSFDDVRPAADAIIDFSRPEAIDGLLGFAVSRRLPAVLATTGYTPAQQAEIDRAAGSIAVFQSFNMSLGVSLAASLVKKAAAFLEGFDIEIVETHHNQKVDAPSGTAFMLADAANSGLSQAKKPVTGREGSQAKRTDGEIGIHAVRGGSIVGEHEVLFFGQNESLSITHRAHNRGLFAAGALRAAEFLQDKRPGKYNMDDIINSL